MSNLDMIAWTAQTDSGIYLCEGNPVDGLSYHICIPYEAERIVPERVIFCRTRREIERHIAIEKAEVKSIAHDWRKMPSFKPKRVAVSIHDIVLVDRKRVQDFAIKYGFSDLSTKPKK